MGSGVGEKVEGTGERKGVGTVIGKTKNKIFKNKINFKERVCLIKTKLHNCHIYATVPQFPWLLVNLFGILWAQVSWFCWFSCDFLTLLTPQSFLLLYRRISPSMFSCLAIGLCICEGNFLTHKPHVNSIFHRVHMLLYLIFTGISKSNIQHIKIFMCQCLLKWLTRGR